jgi:hypothetical protein
MPARVENLMTSPFVNVVHFIECSPKWVYAVAKRIQPTAIVEVSLFALVVEIASYAMNAESDIIVLRHVRKMI